MESKAEPRETEYKSEIRSTQLLGMRKDKYQRLGEKQKLDLFFQIVFSDRKHDTVIIIKKKKGRRMLDAGREYTSKAPANLPRQFRSPKNDYYLTKNTYKSLSSNACIKDLQALNNIVVDIDCHQKMSVTRYEKALDKVKAQIEECLEKEDLPPYAYAVDTGRGLHLWWSITSCYASKKNIGIYRSVASWICSLLKKYITAPFDVDTAASVNPAGLVRFPYTFNKKGFHEKVLLCFRQPFRMDMHKFFEKHKEKIYKAFPISKKRYKAAGGDRALTAALARLEGLIRVIRARDYPAGSEMRNNNLFCACCFFTKILDEDLIWEKVEEVNACFKKPMPEKEYRNYLSTAMRKKMTISNLGVARMLGYSKEEMDLFGMRIRKKIKPPCRYRGRNRDILICLKAGMKDGECARQVGCSKTTVRNVRKQNGIANWGVRIRRKVQGLLDKGMRISKAARKAGCCRDTVYRIIKELKMKALKQSERQPARYWNPPVVAAIGRAYAGKAFWKMTASQKKDAFAKGYTSGLRYDPDRMEVYQLTELSETKRLCI